MGVVERLAALAAALVIDRLVGDPRWLWSRVPHPVVVMGRLIQWLDRRWNIEGEAAATRRLWGIAVAAVVILGGLVVGLALHLAFTAVPFGYVLEGIGVAILLAHGSLLDHVRRVADALATADPDSARRAVAEIVGRDVRALEESGIARAAIESLAENFSDGVVAPVFWYVLLGLPGLIAYKTVNTADSMIGHRSPRHLAFGWATARLDDALNLVPARLSALLIALAGLPRGAVLRAIRTAWRDASSHASPNAGWPEAAAAGALGVALGGPRSYEGRAVAGTWLNPTGRRDIGAKDIRAGLRLVAGAWGLLVIVPALGFLLAR